MDWVRTNLFAVVLVVGTVVIFGRCAASAESILPMLDILLAPDTKHDPRETFKVVDKDGDGKITRAELRVRIMTVFSKKDIDRDFKLAPNEIPAINSEALKTADMNNDGTLSAFEFNQADFTKFEYFDTSKDGVITLDEVLEIRARMK